MALIHRWKLAENANDSVGTINLNNYNEVTFSADGASLNGTSQWLGSGGIGIPTQGTIIAWVRPNGWSNSPGVAGWYNSGDNLMLIAPRQTLYSGLMGVLMTATSGYSVGIGGQTFNATNYPSTIHNLVALKFDANYLYLQENDGAVQSVAMSMVSTASNFAVGRKGNFASSYFSGLIADVRMYDNILSQSEVADLYAAGPNPLSGPLRLAQVF